ncbi:MAG: T9SS type A sorting domain-containing protein [Bacteroidetes bacterium]|nr:T9SS type A sorting domain-containing protein [Bacteroidota bacterium]MBS1609089.1 T9SS type A sorting domain-containing protein [Bacteroidota bacterium]
MKKSLLLLPLLLSLIFVKAQLQWLNPQPSGFTGNKIQFVDNSNGYLINSNGDFFASSDTGNTWNIAGNFSLSQTFRINDSTGIIPAYDTSFYISSDNGRSWIKEPLPVKAAGNWVDIVGRDTIFLLDANSISPITFLKSVDRGKTWVTIASNTDQFFTDYIDFITSKIGYALRADGLYKTTDGGYSWQVIREVHSSSNYRALKFHDTQNGIMFRTSDSLMKTSDGGVTWQSVYAHSDRITDIFYADINHIYAIGEDGAMYKTTNGGTSWNFVNAFPGIKSGYNLYSQYFFNTSTGIITGLRGRLTKTYDGGNTWKQYSPTYVDVTALSFSDKNTGYATTWNNVYKTTNAGKSWGQLNLSTDENAVGLPRFERCYFASKDTGFVTVNNPVRIYTTTNGGNTWAIVNPAPTDYDYNNIADVSFISTDTGYIALRNTPYQTDGVFRTDNGGNNWTRVGGTQPFSKLFFLNNKLGYAVNYSTFFRTMDGGVSWTQVTPDYDYVEITSLYFVNPSKGFITGAQGYLKMTIDSGVTWTKIPIDQSIVGSIDVAAIKFYTDKIGYITDKLGRIFKTADGGYNWYFSARAFTELSSIDFRSDSTVVFAGLYGAIVADRIDTYGIDSIKAALLPCSIQLSGIVAAPLSQVDSIFFEYGNNAFNRSVKGNPSSVKDSVIKSSVAVYDVSMDTSYKFRMKIYSKGTFYYSDEGSFTPQTTVPKPLITASYNLLTSSYTSGNQWYLNGDPIPGATEQTYAVTKAGKYSVTAVQDGCISPHSDEYNFSRVPLPLHRTSRLIAAFPNPVTNGVLTIATTPAYSDLTLVIYDIYGRDVARQKLLKGVSRISMERLVKGIYILKIVDNEKNVQLLTDKIIKL